ncbi:hypothetical protein ABBQ38_000418 [Trebouxia sp. C0009 RCD-2024]
MIPDQDWRTFPGFGLGKARCLRASFWQDVAMTPAAFMKGMLQEPMAAAVPTRTNARSASSMKEGRLAHRQNSELRWSLLGGKLVAAIHHDI